MNVDVVVVGKCDSILDGGSVVNPRPRASRVGGTSLNYLGWVGGRTKTLLRCRGTDGEGPTGSAANDASLSGLLRELVVGSSWNINSRARALDVWSAPR